MNRTILARAAIAACATLFAAASAWSQVTIGASAPLTVAQMGAQKF